MSYSDKPPIAHLSCYIDTSGGISTLLLSNLKGQDIMVE